MKYIKKKSVGSLGFRTPSHIRGSKFSAVKQPQIKFDPSRFKIQHKG